MTAFHFQDILELGPDTTTYRKFSDDGVKTVEAAGRTFLEVSPEALTKLAKEAFFDINHYFRTSQLEQWAAILDDPEATGNDKFVALELLRNANISAAGEYPSCQDTGTAIIMGKKGENVLTGANDAEALSKGVFEEYTSDNLRYSQNAPINMWDEVNTGTNLPAQIEIYAEGDDAYKFLFIAKGGGSANKSFLFQETKAVVNPGRLWPFVEEKLRLLGTAACPPYHLALVVGGTSAEYALKTAKYASCRYLDGLPTEGNKYGRGFRDLEAEAKVLEIAQGSGIGAQFGGKYMALDARVIRLPRQAVAKITKDGIFLEDLDRDPARFLPEAKSEDLGGDVVTIDLNQGMETVLAELTKYPVKTRLSLNGTMVVARDIAHAKISEKLDAGGDMPQYMKDFPVYYAGPAKTPKGEASGSFGPTTAGRMDSYVDKFQAAGGSMVMVAKGNRSQAVTDACKRHGGFYLGSIGGPAAVLGKEAIKKVEVLEYPELGMEAVWKIEVENFPAFIIVDDKGNDFFAEVLHPVDLTAKK